MSQRKMASPALRRCRWSGVKAAACTGSECPMYTWGQHGAHTETPPFPTARPGQNGGRARGPRGARPPGSSPARVLCSAHLAAGARLRQVVPHLDGTVGSGQQQAGIPTESQGGAGHRVPVTKLQGDVLVGRRSEPGKPPFSEKAPLRSGRLPGAPSSGTGDAKMGAKGTPSHRPGPWTHLSNHAARYSVQHHNLVG